MRRGLMTGLLLVFASNTAALAQERMGVAHLASLPPPGVGAPSGSVMMGSCDSDWDGAVLGSALGAAAGFGLTALANDGCHEGFCVVGAALGAIAGFWGGLAIDSRGCDDGARAPATRDVWPSRP